MRSIFFALILLLSAGAQARTTGRIITDEGTIAFSLFNDGAPITVNNFMDLALGRKKYVSTDGRKIMRPFYNGLIFHRVHPDLGIFSGCPYGNGRGWPGFYIQDENAKESKFNRPGLMAMAKIAGENRAGSQFFITVNANPRLDGKYTIFGEVTSGWEVLQKISNAERDLTMKPKKAIHIIKIEFDGV
jgi:peptidyl-prolyl cis-trans isomerase A (cyclophilin A)